MKTKVDTKFLTLAFLLILFLVSLAEPLISFMIAPLGGAFVINLAYCSAFGFKYSTNN